MTYDFDQTIDRRRFESIKWHRYGEDVLPLWVADMDFRSPEPVIEALRERVEHGVFGYGRTPEELPEVITERLERLYDWRVSAEDVMFLPGVVTGFNLVCHALASAGEGVLLQTPVYYPMLRAPAQAGLTNDQMELTRRADGRYEVDFERMEETITERTRVFILCNPHNPVGRVFRREELERMAEICLRQDVVICSDEIHGDLILDGHHHVPIASLAPEIAERTVTLMAPSKTYNIAGLKCSLAIVQNPELRDKLEATYPDLVPSVNVLGYAAALAAYREGQPWLDALLEYLEANLDFLIRYVDRDLPGVTMVRPEGTYLAWLNCLDALMPGNPHGFFLERARVAVNDGASFGRGGEGFVRLNFGCPRSTLAEALDRMSRALSTMG
ncbi:MAG: PatB family C-S lyase [Chloroflexota bacterium]|nr:PatB family C-S lyase [Chloroflexota bacterium]